MLFKIVAVRFNYTAFKLSYISSLPAVDDVIVEEGALAEGLDDTIGEGAAAEE